MTSVYSKLRTAGVSFTVRIKAKGPITAEELARHQTEILEGWVEERRSQRSAVAHREVVVDESTPDSDYDLEMPPDIDPEQFEIVRVEDQRALARLLVASASFRRIGFDVETARQEGLTDEQEKVLKTGLDPYRCRLRLVQIAVPGTVYVVDVWKVGVEWLDSVLDGAALIIGHNLDFDLRVVHRLGIAMPPPEKLHCTMLADHLLTAGEGRGVRHGLQYVVPRYLGIEIDKEQQTSAWHAEELSEEQIRYAAFDSHVLLALADVQEARLAHADLNRAFEIEMGCLPALAAMKLAGAPFDKEAWAKLADAAEAECEAAEQEIGEMLDMALVPKTPAQLAAVFAEYGYEVEPEAVQMALDGKTRFLLKTQKALKEICDVLGIEMDKADIRAIVVDRLNLASNDQKQALLRDLGFPVDSVDEDTLRSLEGQHPVIEPLLRLQKAGKRATTYGYDFFKYVNPVTGRLHGDFKQCGTESGRLSCENPNLQNVPRAYAYRACFRAPAGRKLVKCDYSQIELRIAAVIANEERMLQAYRSGEDLHRLTAALILGKDIEEVTKDDRQIAKSLNFGLLYGMGAEKLQVYAKTNYHVDLTLEQATEFRDRWFQAYPAIAAWHKSTPYQQIDTRTLAGRRRKDVLRFTEKVNTPVQGTGGDGVKVALWRAHEDIARGLVPGNVKLVLTVHDEIVAECDEAAAQEVAEWLVRTMELAMGEVLKGVPIEVEPTVAKAWAEAK